MFLVCCTMYSFYEDIVVKENIVQQLEREVQCGQDGVVGNWLNGFYIKMLYIHMDKNCIYLSNKYRISREILGDTYREIRGDICRGVFLSSSLFKEKNSPVLIRSE